MRLSREDFMKSIKDKIGEDNSDEAVTFLENMTDTFDEMEKEIKGDGVDWKAMYEKNDKEWRDKYTARFYQGSTQEDDIDDHKEPEPPKTFEELFKTGE